MSLRVQDIVRPKQQPRSALGSSSGVEFNVHSCYNDFFLLRTPIAYNGRPVVIELVNGEPLLRVSGITVKLSAILQQAVAPVVCKYGVYSVTNLYCEEVALFSITFQSKSSLKQFLINKQAAEKKVSSTVTRLFELPQAQSQSPSSGAMTIAVGVEVYLVSPNVKTSPEIRQVNLANYVSIAMRWHESKRFDFNSSMFTDQATNSGGDENADLADLQVELQEVIKWFELGVQLKIPTHLLLAIREDQRTVGRCRLEMLIQWEQLEKPTWNRLFSALVNIGMKGLADSIAKKYGLSQPFHVTATHAKAFVENEQKLAEKTEELKKAKELHTVTSQKLEKEVSEQVPLLQKKVTKLTREIKILRKQLKNRNEELEMFEKALANEDEEQSPESARVLEEKNEQIKSLQDEITQKDRELDATKKQLKNKDTELAGMMEELRAKSDRVFELENEVESLKQSFLEQQEELNRKLIERSAAFVSPVKYLKEIEIQREISVNEASKKKEEIQSYIQELSDKEEKINLLSEKIAEQEREMIKLQEELDSHHHTSEQLSATQMREDEREEQLLTQIIKVFQLKLEERRNEDERNRLKMVLKRMQGLLEKREKEIAETSQRAASDKVEEVMSLYKPDPPIEEKSDSTETKTILSQSVTPAAVNETPTKELEVQRSHEDQDECLKVKSFEEQMSSVTQPIIPQNHNNQGNVIALYSFTGRDDQELSFKEGDILQVTEKNSPDWWYGMDSDGRQGLIPVKYVEIQKEDHPLQSHSDLPIPLTHKRQGNEENPWNVIALYSFTGRDDQELSFKEGDVLQVTEKNSPDWWYGMDSDGRQGLIPVKYVDIQEDLKDHPLQSHSDLDLPLTHKHHGNKENPWNVIALYSFTGRDDQELSFKEGDVLQVTEKNSPDWWYGMDSDGREGLIPAKYVEIQEPLSSSEDCPVQVKQLQQRNTKLDEIKFSLEGLRADLEAREVQLREKEKELQQRDADISELFGELKSCQSELETAQESVRSKDKLLLQKEVQLTSSQFQSGKKTRQMSLSKPKLSLKLKWTQGRNMPFKMSAASAVVMRGKVYVGGGETYYSDGKQDDRELTSRTVCIYNPYTDSWSQLPPYDYYKYFRLTVINETQLVAVGGQDTRTLRSSNKVAVWDDTQSQWAFSLPAMDIACHSPAVVTYNQWLLVAGGYGERGCLSRVEVMSISFKQWYKVSSLVLPVTGYQMSSTMIGNVWYLMGGYTNDGSTSVMSACVEDIISEAVSLIQPTGANPWKSLPDTPFERSTALAFQGALLAIGGWRNGPTSTIYLYKPSASKWIKVGDMPIGRKMPACTVLPDDGQITIVGGDGGDKAEYVRHQVDIAQV